VHRTDGLVRLSKHLAALGVASRRRAVRLIAEGRVTVDGALIDRLGALIDPDADVRVDGSSAPVEGPREYVIYHKPVGLLCTRSDPSGRPTVTQALPDEIKGLFPVGRLDRDTSGLLLLTSDGEFAHAMTHPDHGVLKAYVAEVDGCLTELDLTCLRQGVKLKDGMTKPADAEVTESGVGRTKVRLTIREGRHRQVRRMFRALGGRVRTLSRIRVGPLELGALGPGQWRRLTRQEVDALLAAASGAAQCERPEGSARDERRHRSRPGR